jgi:hypothetical protein
MWGADKYGYLNSIPLLHNNFRGSVKLLSLVTTASSPANAWACLIAAIVSDSQPPLLGPLAFKQNPHPQNQPAIHRNTTCKTPYKRDYKASTNTACNTA